MNISYSAKGLAASYRLGLIGAVEFRELAGVVNSESFFSERLLNISLMHSFDSRLNKEIDLFVNDEMGIHDMKDALKCYVIFISLKITSDNSFSLNGAGMIWNASVKSRLKIHDYDTFIYAASEASSRPNMAQQFIEAILAEAGVWASKEDGDPAYDINSI